MEANYPECYKALRRFEGGNDDDPHDPGGRTSRGILQSEWDRFRKTHPGRPSDVWEASEADVAAIYKQDYWNRQKCAELPSGLDEAIFDYGVNSGTGRSQKVLRRCLHMADDASFGEVMKRLAVLDKEQTKSLIVAINDERLAFLKSLKTWARFGRGWGKRVAKCKEISLHLADFPGTALPAATTAKPLVEKDDTSAKAQYAQSRAAKTAIRGAGGASVGGSLAAWIQTNPLEAVAIAAAIAAVSGIAIHLINRWHKHRQEAVVVGWVPPTELRPG